MRTEGDVILEEIESKFIKYKMSRKDKKLLIESVILTVIYLLSFGILSLGRVRQAFFGIPGALFSGIQIIILIFVFAVVITLAIYYLYKKAVK